MDKRFIGIPVGSGFLDGKQRVVILDMEDPDHIRQHNDYLLERANLEAKFGKVYDTFRRLQNY